MKDLKELRAQLDQLDRELVRLFEGRMELSRQVAAVKLQKKLPVLDQGRERDVLDSRADMALDPCWKGEIRELYQKIMELSRREQARMLREADKDA